MTDFGRKDFGDALKKLFEAGKDPLVDPTKPEIDSFGATDKDAVAASKIDQPGLKKIGDNAQKAMKDFVALWTPFAKTLKDETKQAVHSLELFAASNKSVADDTAVTDDQAATAAFGGTKDDLKARKAAALAAPAGRETRADDKITSLGQDEFGVDKPADPKAADALSQQMYGDKGREQARLASMPGVGDDRRLKSQIARQKRRTAAAPPATEGALSDFSTLLLQMVENINEAGAGTSFLHMSPEERAAAGVKSPRGKAPPMREMIKTLRNFALTVDKQVAVLDDKLKTAMKALLSSSDKMGKTYKGLSNLTKEQQEHITSITNQANERLMKLKKDLEPLTKLKGAGAGGVQALVDKVAELEGDLQKKQDEMDAQEQEYEALLDYYEDIMIDMKKAEMEAKKELRNMEAEMAGGMTDKDFAHYEPKGEPLTEEVKRPRKKKKKRPTNYSHYGTFNFNEHLEKARKTHPKTPHDW